MRSGIDILLVEGMEHGMAGSIRCSTGTGRLFTAEVLTLTAKGPLINPAIFQTGKRYSIMFQFDNRIKSRTAHIFNGILIAQVITAFYRIIHMPMPVIIRDISQSSINTALCRHRMRTG